MSDFRVADLIVQCLDKTRHIFSQVSNYGYLNSTILIVMVTATGGPSDLYVDSLQLLFNVLLRKVLDAQTDKIPSSRAPVRAKNTTNPTGPVRTRPGVD